MQAMKFYVEALQAHARGEKLPRSVRKALIEDGYLAERDGVDVTTHAGNRLMLKYEGGLHGTRYPY